MFLNTNPQAPKLAVKSFFLHIARLGGTLFSYLLWMFSFSEIELDSAYLLFMNWDPPVSSANVIASPGSLLNHSLPSSSLFDDSVNSIHIQLNSNSTLHYLMQR